MSVTRYTKRTPAGRNDIAWELVNRGLKIIAKHIYCVRKKMAQDLNFLLLKFQNKN